MDTVYELKESIEKVIGLDSSNQKLTFQPNHEELKDKETMHFYEIRKDASLWLTHVFQIGCQYKRNEYFPIVEETEKVSSVKEKVKEMINKKINEENEKIKKEIKDEKVKEKIKEENNAEIGPYDVTRTRYPATFMSLEQNTLGDHLRCIHYLGRDFEGAPDMRVWFGGQPLTVRELVALVANHFEIAPERCQKSSEKKAGNLDYFFLNSMLREVLAELDALIRFSDYGTATTQISTTESARHSRVNDDDNNRHHRSANNDQNQQQNLMKMNCFNSNHINQCRPSPMIQALSTLHRLTIKGTRTFHTPSTNSLSLLIRSASSANNPQNQIQ
ncbi:hypothetical protein niasHT_024860 [Heterodera trifolii]|uniref:Ubiquitin-like domain-containing protein n=1 Tax=Heterodera trifolii TaxID=157864 RepID=A0ABD2JG57_9BILA